MKAILLFLTLFISSVSFCNTDRYRLMFNTDPSTEITVGWEQVSGSNPIVYFGTTDHGTNWANYANNHGVDRQVTYQGMDNRFSRLTGLTPNTIYYFVIKDSQGTSQRYWFRTCPNTSTETLSFISGGDSRSGSTQRRNSNRMVAKIRPHAVLFGGDLQNTPSESVMQQWLDDWQLTITSDNQMIPVVHSFGNHEDNGNGGPNLIRDLFDTPYDVYYNVRFGGNLFSMYTLNGEVLPGHTIANNTVRIAQRNWLNTTLQADNSIWKGAQYHRPIVPHYSGKGEGNDEFYDWVNLFYEYGVRIVMESDAHVVKMTEEVRPVPAYTGLPHTSPGGNSSNWFTTTGIDPDKGITFIGEGTWGTIRTPDDSHPMTSAMASFYGFNWLLVDACKIEVRSIDTQNPGAVPEHVAGDYTSISSGLDAQIWKPTALPSGVRTISKCYPPIADFTADQTAVFTGTTVNFTDLSTNTPTSWSWDFGDGNTSTQQSPSNQYNSAGTYTVTLTASNGDGSGTEVKTAYIVVSDPVPPTANFLADITSASVGQNINFTDQSTGVPSTWSWNFGDGTTSSAANPSHSYAAPGVYTVTLEVTNAYGNDTEIKTAYITILNGGTVSVSINSGSDDAEQFRVGGIAGDMYLTSSDLEIGNDGGDEQYVGLRFNGINVPQGATISNAYIRFRADENDGAGSQLNIYMKAQDADNPSTFTSTNSDISNRTLTTAQLTWPDGSVPAWTTPNLYNTPDISTLIQEVVNRPGWSSGNSMVFVLWSDLNESSERVADSYEGGYPAELVFEYTVPAPPAPVAAFTATSTAICEGEDLNLSDQSTNTPTTWDWSISGPVTLNSTLQNPSFTFNTPGTYNVSLTVTNAGGSNTQVQNTYITVNPRPSIIASGTTAICEGSSTTLSVNGGDTYSWDNGVGTSATPSVAPTSTTTYTVIGTDVNGCSNSDQVTITVNALPVVAASGSTAICEGSSATLSASGADSYTWDNGAGTGATPTVSPLTSTTYTVTGTDANGCENTDQATITVMASPNVSATGTASICTGETTPLSASGANSYTWDNGGGTGASTLVSPTTTTIYTVTGTDLNGCSNTDQVTITVNAIPNSPTISANGPLTFCSGGSVTLSSSETSGNNWSTSATSSEITVANSGTYTVTYTDANGCQATSTPTTVVVNSIPTINSAAVVHPVTCGSNTGSIQINGTGNGNITWSGTTAGSQNSISLPYTISGLSAGLYDITFTDDNGCSSNTLSEQLTDPNAPTSPVVTANGSLTFCDGESVTLSSSETNGNMWSTSATTQEISVTTSGTYSVTYTDANGCSATSTPITVIVNPLPTSPIITANGQTTICSGETVTLSSSQPNNNEWSTGATTSSIQVADAGTYTVTYTDGNGCTATSTATEISVNPLPNVSYDGLADGVCISEPAFSLSGGLPVGGTYSGPGITANSFDPSVADLGTHTITYEYTDANGCTNSASSTIMVTECLSISELDEIGYSIYPNPSDDMIFIERGNNSEVADIQIFDVRGQLVARMTSSDNPIGINVSSWEPGEYLIRLKIGSKHYHEKVIVQ